MPRKDTFHNVVKNALIKDGWTITHDPYTLEFNRETLEPLAKVSQNWAEILGFRFGSRLRWSVA